MQPNYLETVQATRLNHQQGAKQEQDLQSMLDELKKMQLAAMISQPKSSVVLTDQTDLGDKMSELTAKMVDSIGKLKGTNIDDMGIIKALTDGVGAIKSVHEQAGKDHSQHLKTILTAVKGLDMKPQVNVSTDPVDFSPLLEALQDNDDDDTIDFDDYKAQDLKDDGDLQYVGFLNTDGCWYIIENDTKQNSMRYVFGESSYSDAFKKASTYKYKLLNEAVKSVSSKADDAEA